MQTKPNQKNTFVLMLLALFLVLLNAKAQAESRIGVTVYSGVYPAVKVGLGQLSSSNELVIGGGYDIDASLPSYGLSSSVFAEIQGKPLIARAGWDTFVRDGRINLPFKVSSNTYVINNTEYLIISAAGSASGGSSVKVPKVNVGAIDATASETAGDTGQFVINFDAPATKNIKIKFKLEGNAVKGKDYEKFPNSIVIPAGNTQSIIEIIPINDTKKENVEKVIIKLLPDSAKRYTLANPKKAVITITDND